MRMKLIVGLCAIATIFVGGLPSTAEPTPAYSPAHIDYPGTQIVYHVADSFPHFKSSLGYSAAPRLSSTDGKKTVDCSSLQDVNCDTNVVENLSATSILPNCIDISSTNCIESIEISNNSGEFIKTNFIREMGGYSIPGDLDKGLVAGRSASIWASDQVPHAGGSGSYLVTAQLSSNWRPNKKKFIQQSIQVSVLPFLARKGDYAADRWLTDAELDEVAKNSPQWVGYEKKFIPPVRQGPNRQQDCFFYDDGYCGILYDFVEKSRVRAVLRISNELGGWFKGRIQDPIISIQSIAGTKMNKLTIEGAVVRVPRMVFLQPWGKLTGDDEKNYVKYFWGGAPPSELLAGPNSDMGDYAFDFIKTFRDKVNDTASGFTSMWNFSTINAGQGSSCLTDTTKVLGVVTTNSMAYEGSAPRFVNGTLDYRVAGLHFAPDGKTEVKGTYDLIMRSETARCLYGFSSAPISATISITSDRGENSVATTQVSEENGWLKLGAYNFTYSNPTLKVRLTQVKAASNGVATPKIVKPSKKSIICVKGKSTKKVSGVNPKCPTGFKKK